MKHWLYWTLTDFRDWCMWPWLVDRIDDIRYLDFFEDEWSHYD